MKHTPEEIKNRLSNIGEAIGNIALDYIAELEQENAELKCECRRCVYSDCPCILSDYEKDRNGICDHFKDAFDENAELKKQLTELKEFYEIEYFQIADRTADEKIKELEKHQVEVTIDDYSPYDENTWGMMHEEWFVPKEEVRDLLKENYALITKAKELLKNILAISVHDKRQCTYDAYILTVKEAEQFLNEVEK